MKIDLDKETVQAIGVIALLGVLVFLIYYGLVKEAEVLIAALLSKLGLSEGYTLVKSVR